MKRAVFKMGGLFTLESTTENSHAVVKVDVDAWSLVDDRLEDWAFAFDKYEAGLSNVDKDRIGTSIDVLRLHPSISTDFQLPFFKTRVIGALQDAHQDALQKGLAISVNGFALVAEPLVMKMSEYIKPACVHELLEEKGKKPLSIRLYAGVSESEPKAAGWYVYCNGRLVLKADQSEKTVWGELGDVSIPKIHNQFARFRGCAFFDSDDPGRVPWNTTKTGIDADSAAFKYAKKKMVIMTRDVIDFLNELDREKDQDEKPRHEAVWEALNVILPAIPPRQQFHASARPPKAPEVRQARISYSRPYVQVEAVKKKLGVSRNRDVGERTFDYFRKYECE